MDIIFGNLAASWQTTYQRTRQKKNNSKARFGLILKDVTNSKLIVSRNHVSNVRKVKFMRQFDGILVDTATKTEAFLIFDELNPAIPWRTLRGWLARRSAIEAAVETGRSEASSTRSLQWQQKHNVDVLMMKRICYFR